MRITVRATPGARRASVERVSPTEYRVAVTTPPERGKANDAVRRALADALGIAPSRLSLVMGQASRTKVFEIR